MKTGQTLQQMAAEIERQRESKRDFKVDTRELEMVPTDNDMELKVAGLDTFNVRPIAHGQIAQRLDIPKPFYDRLLEGKFDRKGNLKRQSHPELLADTVNTLFKSQPERRMVRVLDNNVRAFLSNSYRALDNYDCASSLIPVLQEQPRMNVVSNHLTESKLYIKAVFPKIEGEVKVGDVVQAGVVISNSEVGMGSVSVRPLLYRLWCDNGCTTDIGSKRKYHTGKRSADNGSFEVYSDETQRLTDRAFWAQVQDLVRNCTKQETFDAILEQVRATTDRRIVGSVQKAVELTAKTFDLREDEQSDVLRHLIDGGDLTQYGLLNAITRTSQDVDSYDRASELERIGGKVIELPKTQWTQLAEAA